MSLLIDFAFLSVDFECTCWRVSSETCCAH